MKFSIKINGVDVYTLASLKQNFDCQILLENRKNFAAWLGGADEKEKAKQVRELKELSDDAWLDKVAEIIDCEEKLKLSRQKEKEERERLEAERKEREAYPNFAICMNSANIYNVDGLRENFDIKSLKQSRPEFYKWLRGSGKKDLAEQVKKLSPKLSDDVWLIKTAEIIDCKAELKRAVELDKMHEAERQRLAAAEAERQRLAVEEAERLRRAAEEAERQQLSAEAEERRRLAAMGDRERELYPSFPIVVDSTNCYCLNDLRVNFNANTFAFALIRYRPQLYAWLRGAGEKELAKQVKDLSPELADGAWLLAVSKILGIENSLGNLRQTAFLQMLSAMRQSQETKKREEEVKKKENGSALKTALGVTAGVAGAAGVGALIALTGGAGLAAAVGAGALGLGKLLGKDKK